MDAVRNDRTETWHLLGSRGCGIDPDGDAYADIFHGTWAEVRDEVARDTGSRCRNCRWPR
ncbi:MAG: hypothetical protein R3324_12170 [Halobacteriales archaeon]|nr:hypothetical protein [Halobacteriales archaeon]